MPFMMILASASPILLYPLHYFFANLSVACGSLTGRPGNFAVGQMILHRVQNFAAQNDAMVNPGQGVASCDGEVPQRTGCDAEHHLLLP